VEAELSTIILLSEKTIDPVIPHKFYITLKDKSLYLRTIKLFKNAYKTQLNSRSTSLAGNSKAPEYYRIYFDAQNYPLLKRIGVIDTYGFKRGLASRVNLGAVEDTLSALRIAIIMTGSFYSQNLNLTIDNFVRSNAVAGLFRKVGLRPDRKNIKNSQIVLYFHDRTTVGNLLEILGASKSAQIYRKLFPTILPSVTDGKTKILIQKIKQPNSIEITVYRTVRALELLENEEHIKDSLTIAGRLRVKHPQMSVEKLANLHKPPVSKDAMAGRIRRLIQQADDLAERYNLESTLAYALRVTNSAIND
jgi:DNA-binding transcriptional regulator WhiA